MPTTIEKWRSEYSFGDNTSRPVLTALDNDRFAVAWGGPSVSIEFQIFDPLGNPVGSQVNLQFAGGPFQATDIVALSNGNIAVTLNTPGSIPYYAVIASDGALVRSTTALSTQNGLNVAIAPFELSGHGPGEFLAVWWSSGPSPHTGVFARLIGNDGLPAGNEFQISSDGFDTNIAALGAGAVVAWAEPGVGFGNTKIAFRIYNEDGTSSSELIASEGVSSKQGHPALAALNDGRFVIVWDNFSGATDQITARIFNHDGSPWGPSFVVSTFTDNIGNRTSAPDVTALDDGGFLITFHAGTIANTNTFAHAFDGNGNTIGSDFRVNANPGLVGGDLATLLDGRVVSTYQTFSSSAKLQILDARAGDLVGDASNNVIVGRDIGQSNPNDLISGGLGDDTLIGVGGDDVLFGGSGNDGLGGNAGNDTIVGEDGNDTIGGDDGNDNMNGGLGNDVIFGGAGDDMLGGGAGNDIVVGNDGNDAIFGEDGADQANGGAGADIMLGGLGNDTFGGGAGNDIVVGGDEDDLLFGEDGADNINGEFGNDGVVGGAGDDVLGGGAGDDIAVGDDGNDVLFGETGNDAMNGGFGNDILLGGDGHDMLGGGAGDDDINGGFGNDILFGENGNDILNGSAGNDVYVGGGNDDVFVFSPGDGADTIADFFAGATEDRIWFAGTDLHSFADVQSHATTVTSNTVITYNGFFTVTLNGVSAAQLTAADFIFS